MELMKKKYDERKGFLLGVTHEYDYVYLSDFSWDCDWYWGGGYIHLHHKNRATFSTHTHFDSVFFNRTSTICGDNDGVYIDVVKKSFRKSTLTEEEWWRLMDLMKQFYAIRQCAEVFQYGGHLTSRGRTEEELNQFLASELNLHIKKVIIPEVKKLLQGEG